MILYTKYQSSKPCTVRQEDFLIFYSMYIVKSMIPGGGANFDPRAIICTILLEVHYIMFHAKYLNSSLCKFKEDDFLNFLQYTYKENLWPPGRG
jgi:hypothetical protein